MNWLVKLERKLGRFAVPNLIKWLIGAYTIGFVIVNINPTILQYMLLDPHAILHGQVWRLITWIFIPTSGDLISLLFFALLYYQLGSALERQWGTFRFNVYIFGGMLFTIIGAFALYGIMAIIYEPALWELASLSVASGVNTGYIYMSIFLAFAVMFPELQVMLMFIIPIKMKWMAIAYGVITLLQFFQSGWAGKICIFMSLLNFLIFFLSTRNLQRYTPHEVHRRQQFKRQMREPRPGSGITKHKCAVCGRTEVSNPELEFRFCSKCEGNYEYCQDHLFTHQHIRRM